MGKYVDGFVVPIEKDSIDDYCKLSEAVSRRHIELGALEYLEAVGDDLDSEHTDSFKEMAGISEDETVVFAYVVYSSKEDRDRVNACIMEDGEITAMMEPAAHVFDPKRMAFGGFRPIVEAKEGSTPMEEMKGMGKYVDGFVLPLKKEKVDAYQRMSEKASKIWIEHGALEYFECVGDDLESEQTANFREMAGAGEDETVIFAFIVYASKEDRDRANTAIMEDERIKEMMKDEEHPFDPKRMAYGGFRAIVEASKEQG